MFVMVMVALGVVWCIWIVQAWLSAWQWRKFAGKFTHIRHGNKALKPSVAIPSAVIIVPFKGLDLDLPKAIAGLCTLDYPDYQLLLVVDSKADPVHALLQKELARYPQVRSQILMAGPASLYEGQKVHNQLFAINHLMEQRQTQGAEFSPQAWVFADSDAIPGPKWLADLIRPLRSPTVGMTTGYRWLEPVPAPGSLFWSAIASVINSSVIGFLGKARYNHAWGGSMALWAQTAIRGDLRGHLEGALCDDYQFSIMVRKLGLRIYFVRSCLVATPVHFNWHGLVNFAHRQYLLTRVYAPGLFALALLMVGFYVVAQITAWAALIVLFISDPSAWYFWGIPLLAMLVVAFWNHVRASMRRLSAVRALDEKQVARLRLPLFLDRWCTWLWMSVHLVLILRAVTGRTMLWRGIYYRLHGPQKVERMNLS